MHVCHELLDNKSEVWVSSLRKPLGILTISIFQDNGRQKKADDPHMSADDTHLINSQIKRLVVWNLEIIMVQSSPITTENGRLTTTGNAARWKLIFNSRPADVLWRQIRGRQSIEQSERVSERPDIGYDCKVKLQLHSESSQTVC